MPGNCFFSVNFFFDIRKKWARMNREKKTIMPAHEHSHWIKICRFYMKKITIVGVWLKWMNDLSWKKYSRVCVSILLIEFLFQWMNKKKLTKSWWFSVFVVVVNTLISISSTLIIIIIKFVLCNFLFVCYHLA